jgi:hypothetical protein
VSNCRENDRRGAVEVEVLAVEAVFEVEVVSCTYTRTAFATPSLMAEVVSAALLSSRGSSLLIEALQLMRLLLATAKATAAAERDFSHH